MNTTKCITTEIHWIYLDNYHNNKVTYRAKEAPLLWSSHHRAHHWFAVMSQSLNGWWTIEDLAVKIYANETDIIQYYHKRLWTITGMQQTNENKHTSYHTRELECNYYPSTLKVHRQGTQSLAFSAS